MTRQGKRLDHTERALLREYIDAVYVRCHRMLRDPEWAWDALQDVFANFYQSAKHTEIRDPRGYLYQMSTNHCLNLLKKKKRALFLPIDEFSQDMPVSTHTDAEYGMFVEQIQKTFGDEAVKLLIYRYVDQMTYGEVAILCGLSDRGVKKKLDRLLPRIRDFLQAAEHGVNNEPN